MNVLSEDFYARDTREVAKELVGKVLVFTKSSELLSGMIVETEAYYGVNDPASHASRGLTPRSSIMFGPPGYAYIYLNYGIHYLLNVVTEEEGKPGAVLIRAIQPISGIDIMKTNRRMANITNLTNGPGKLTRAFGIDLDFNGHSLLSKDLFISNGQEKNLLIDRSTRIGIRKGQKKLLRFFIKNNKYVSKG